MPTATEQAQIYADKARDCADEIVEFELAAREAVDCIEQIISDGNDSEVIQRAFKKAERANDKVLRSQNSANLAAANTLDASLKVAQFEPTNKAKTVQQLDRALRQKNVAHKNRNNAESEADLAISSADFAKIVAAS